MKIAKDVIERMKSAISNTNTAGDERKSALISMSENKTVQEIISNAVNCPGGNGAIVISSRFLAKEVLIFGPKGVMSVTGEKFTCEYLQTMMMLRWSNGSCCHVYAGKSVHDLESRLRGVALDWAVVSDDPQTAEAYDIEDIKFILAQRTMWSKCKELQAVSCV